MSDTDSAFLTGCLFVPAVIIFVVGLIKVAQWLMTFFLQVAS